MTSLPRSALYKYIYCLYFIIALIGICLLYSARMSLFRVDWYPDYSEAGYLCFAKTYSGIHWFTIAHMELRIEQDTKYFCARIRARDHSHFLGLTYLHKYSLCCGASKDHSHFLWFDQYITCTSCSDDFDCSLMFEEDKNFNLPKWVRHYANGSTWKRHSHSFPWFDLYPLHRMCTLLGGHWLLSNGS